MGPSHAEPGSLAAALEDPCFFLVDFDFEADTAVFSRAQREWFRDKLRLSAFDFPIESLVALPTRPVLRLLPSEAELSPTINYLFHLPFCGSSFLTRHLEHNDEILLLRDPAALDAVFRTRGSNQYPTHIHELRRLTLTCFGRTSEASTPVVRTAGYYPRMIEPLIASPTFRAGLLLYSSPEHYLLQVLKSVERRRHVRLLMVDELPFVLERTGQPLATLTDVEVAALFWVHHVEMILRVAGDRLRTLDCERLFADPDDTVASVCRIFGTTSQGPSEQAGRLRSTHAKTGESFSLEMRERTLAHGLNVHDFELKAAQPILQAADATAMLARLDAMRL